MPARLFRAGADLPDDELARVYAVPVGKVAERRAELRADRDGPRPGRMCAELESMGPARPVTGVATGRDRRRRGRHRTRR